MRNIADHLEEIANWRLEAKEEDTARYFFSPPGLERMHTGLASIILGRKGAGKTAVAEHINGLQGHDVSIRNLSFKNFPFNILYQFSDQRFKTSSQYTTVWLYIMYCAICGMLADKDTLDPHTTKELREHFHAGFAEAISEKKKTSAGNNFSFNVLNILGTEVGGDIDVSSNETPMFRRVEILERLISDKIDDNYYYILFDELDEDYENILTDERADHYFELLTGLFKAVAAVRSNIGMRTGIRPIIFLRDDIYALIKNNDKNKWQDSVIDLKWSSDAIQNLMSFRILRAKNADAEKFSITEARKSIFDAEAIRYGTRGKDKRPTFKHLLTRTLMRPRDIVSFLRECARVALQRGAHGINADMIRDAEANYSTRFRSELEDEIQSIIPEIEKVFDAISLQRKQIFRLDEFEAFLSEMDITFDTTLPLLKIFEVLFHFSAIGNIATQRSNRIYRYENPRATFNPKELICVHQGLMKTLRIT
jgi:hypothetical protein